MPDNNPTFWPPAPATINKEAVPSPAHSKAGNVSLYLVCPMAAVLFFDWSLWFTGIPHVVLIIGYSLLVALAAAVGGMVFGIIGRRSFGGKLGLTMAVIGFFVSLAWLFLMRAAHI